jgi:hypothetical protein
LEIWRAFPLRNPFPPQMWVKIPASIFSNPCQFVIHECGWKAPSPRRMNWHITVPRFHIRKLTKCVPHPLFSRRLASCACFLFRNYVSKAKEADFWCDRFCASHHSKPSLARWTSGLSFNRYDKLEEDPIFSSHLN